MPLVGTIWNLQKPVTTSTIVTSEGVPLWNCGGDLEWRKKSNSALLIYMMPYTDTIQVLGIFTILQ